MKNKKELGQHWLHDRDVLENIASHISGDLCVEIGPGLGTLTAKLLKRADKVLAIEFDPRLAKNLPGSFPGKNLEVVNADVLKFDFSQIEGLYSVAGNIPYYITSPIIDKLLSLKNRPQKIILLIQKEVAERAAAAPGKHSILSLATQNRAAVALGPIVGRNLFTPPPKVDSQVIILTPLKHPVVSPEAIALAKLGFSAPRKKLISNLSATLRRPRATLEPAFKKAQLSPDLRPADLSLEDWQNLYNSIQTLTK